MLHIPSQHSHSLQDSFSFVKEINSIQVSNRFMASFDVVSLFTNIPLKESID